MANIELEIRNWLHQQQDWLQEAAEKLLASGSLSDGDIEAVAERLKTPDGQQITTHRRFEGIGFTSSSLSEVQLLEIGDISGIENLSPRSPLTFGPGNISVIYGPNGSGKSGYTRILKRACGKPNAPEIRSNVYEGKPAKQECRIRYALEGKDQSVTWQPSEAPLEDLGALDIFDADAAAFYISEEKAVSYMPQAVTMFEELASVCDRVKEKLQFERSRLVSQLPNLPPEYGPTPPGDIFAQLRHDLTEQEIQRLTNWGDDNEKEFEKLTERLSAEDPAKLAVLKRNTKDQLNQLRVQTRNAADAVSKQQVEALRNARKSAHLKRRIATEAAQISSAKLDGIGTATWNALWEAARVYSQTAYPGQDYPVTNDGARCVLCHQELAQEAQERLREFETFVQGVVEAEAKSAEDAYNAALDKLPQQWDDEEVRTRCEAAGLSEEGWTEKLGAFWAEFGKTREDLVGGEKDAEAIPLESPDELLCELAKRSESLERDARQYDEDAKHFDREKAGQDKLNLEALRWTAQQETAIDDEIVRLKVLKEYEDWERIANSRNVSLMAGRVAEKVITEAYIDRFNQELSLLGASRIRVELTKTRTQKGRALHGLRLKGVDLTTENAPKTVLSEGERRVVSLAAFLADVAEKPHPAPFIFDDPISSLDQEFEWYVATRLAKLAQTRQVLVFTHRLSLYGAMEDAARKVGEGWKKEHLHQRCIESFSGAAGHPADETFWNANTRKGNNILLARLDVAKKAGATGGGNAYRIYAKGICTDFRILLERTVEDDLLNEIVRRHRRSVTTDNRLNRLASINPEDCEFIDNLMTKYSSYEHSQSEEVPVSLPEEPELRADLESLKSWREEFSKRPTETGT